MKPHEDSVVTYAFDDQERGTDHEHDHGHDGEHPEALWRRVLSITFTIAVVVFTIYLWPAMLGGSTRLVVVSGHSMEPTYDLLDIVVARDAGDTRVGDIVVFEVPEGEAEGMLIIHRVLEVDDEGFFITQGDNRDTPDQWQLTEDDIVGKPLAHIPKGGKALGFIQNIWVIALLVGLVVLFVLWPDDEDDIEDDIEADEHADGTADELLGGASAAAVGSIPESEPAVVGSTTPLDDTDAFERDADWTLVDVPTALEPVEPVAQAAASVDELAERWLDSELEQPVDDVVMADAIAWLDEQLEGFSRPMAH